MKKFFILLAIIVFGISVGASAQDIKKNGFQQFHIGDLEAVVLTDGYIPVSPVQPSMAPGIDKKLLSDQLLKNYQSPEGIELSMNVLLLKKDNHLVLFDTGSGKGMGPTGGWLPQNLALVGVSPEQITDIVITHAHLDHIGGLVDMEGKSIFPNAKIYMSGIEYDFWTGGKADFSNSKLDMSMAKDMLQMIEGILEIVKPQLEFVKDGQTILDCITIQIAPGHTDGHSICNISSKGQSIVHIADIIHAYAILFEHPEWGNGFDSNFDLGVKTRIAVLNKMSARDSLIMGFHLPYPGIGHVKKLATNSFEWIPSAFATPQEQ